MKTLQRIFTLLVVIIVIVVVIGLVRAPKVTVPEAEPIVNNPVVAIEKQNVCFYSEKGITATRADIAWLKATIDGNQISGELKNLPSEKDSKVGLFDGTIASADAAGVRKVDAIWQTRAEGMETPEQLIVNISADKAEVGFGEMVDRGDGTYVYKTPNAIPYFSSIPSVPCTELNERIAVELYVRNYVAAMTAPKATLGGKWYVTSLSLDLKEKKGSVAYEDGHAQKKSSFDYSVSSENNVTVTNFK